MVVQVQCLDRVVSSNPVPTSVSRKFGGSLALIRIESTLGVSRFDNSVVLFNGDDEKIIRHDGLLYCDY
jgi:hypothetical protein